MNKLKFQEICEQELDRLNDVASEFDDVDHWPNLRVCLNEFVKNVDEAYEVYKTENEKK